MEVATKQDAGGTPPAADVKPEGGAPAATAESQVDITAMQKENTELKSRMEALTKDSETSKAYVHQLIANLQAQQGQQQEGEEPDLNEVFSQDPVKAAEYLIQQKIAPLQQNFEANQALMNRQASADRLSNDKKFGKLWGKYEKEVDEFLSKVPMNIRAMPSSVDNAFKFVLLNHFDDVLAELNSNDVEKQKQAFVEGKGLSASPGKPGAELSNEERKVADGLGLSPEEYIRWRDI